MEKLYIGLLIELFGAGGMFILGILALCHQKLIFTLLFILSVIVMFTGYLITVM